jgi:integrase
VSRRRGHVARKQTSQGVRYYPVVELPHDPVTLKRRQKWHPAHTSKRAAERELTRILSALDQGIYVPPTDRTVAQQLTEHLEALRGNIADNTLELYTTFARAWITPALGTVKLQDLDAGALKRFYNSLAASGRRRDGGPLAPKTVRHVHSLIYGMLDSALEQGLLTRNVAALKAARPGRLERREPKVWDPATVRTFLDAVREDRLAALWLLVATTGMRRSELLGLPWRAVDLDAGQLVIVQRLLIVDRKPAIRPSAKTEAGRRTIALDQATVAALRVHKRRQLEERLAWGEAWQDHGLVFTREDGTPLHPNWLTLRFSRLARQAGLPELTPHGLRHSYATAGIVAGVPVKVMSARLGHASVGITSDLYQHAIPALDAEAATKVADVILGEGAR